MLTTYINDKKLSQYPFCDCELPFPPGCITYIGICLKGDPTGYPVYASAVSISLDGVLVSFCRETGGAPEDLGAIYVAAEAGSAHATIGKAVVNGTGCMSIDRSMLKPAYGKYTGKFYLEPTCVVYIPDYVFGDLTAIDVNGNRYAVAQNVRFRSMGDAVELTDPVPENTTDTESRYVAMLRGSTAVNSYSFIAESTQENPTVDSIVNFTFKGTSAVPYPAMTITAGDSIQLNVIQGAEMQAGENPPENAPDVILEICGDSNFPNCYKDAAVPDEAELD